MKIIKLVIIILIIINSGSIFADTNEKEPLYSQLNRAIVRLEHIENTIKEGSKKVITKNISDGTGFFVFHEKSLFIVSARHVVELPLIWTTISPNPLMRRNYKKCCSSGFFHNKKK